MHYEYDYYAANTNRPVTRILCGGGGANEAKVDQTTEIYFLLSIRL